MPETETQPTQPETASVWLPISVLIGAVLLFLIASPIAKSIIGTPLKELEANAAPIATAYLENPTDPEFKSRLDEIVGRVTGSQIVKLGTEKSKPPKFFITIDAKGTKGTGVVTVALTKSGETYKVVDAGVLPR